MIPFTHSHTLDLTKEGDAIVWDISRLAWANVQAAASNAYSGWLTGEVTLQVSLDGSNWDDIGETGITFTANGLSGPFDIRWPKLRAIVTDAASGTAFATVTLHGMEWSN